MKSQNSKTTTSRSRSLVLTFLLALDAVTASNLRRLTAMSVMKPFFIILLVLVAGLAPANSIRQIRSLNASNTPAPGQGFTTATTQLPFYVPGGGISWTVMITFGNKTSLSWDVEGQMTDGTWVAIVAPITTVGGAVGATMAPLIYNFRGPWQDMRVNLLTRAVGTITADIFVEY